MTSDTRRSPTRGMQIACWTWVALVGAYFGWEYATYSGLYRWLAELQLSLVGKYATYLTGILPFVLIAGPALSLLGARARHRRDILGERESVAPDGESELARTWRSARILFALAPLCFAVALGAFLLGRANALPPGAPVLVDLATLGAGAPPDGRVTLMGSVLVDRGVTTTREGGWRTEESFYAPMVARDAAPPSGGFRYFVRRSASRSASEPRLRQLFLGVETGILVPNGLPAEVRAILQERGVPVAEPHWLLTAPSARTDVYYTIAGVAGLVGLILLLGAAAALLGARVRARRAR